jgi:hypothetical protein
MKKEASTPGGVPGLVVALHSSSWRELERKQRMTAIPPRLRAGIDATKGEALGLISDLRVQLEKLEDDLTHDRWRPVSDDRDSFEDLTIMLERAVTRWITLDWVRTDHE